MGYLDKQIFEDNHILLFLLAIPYSMEAVVRRKLLSENWMSVRRVE